MRTCFSRPRRTSRAVGGRSARASFQYTLQDVDIPELVEWSQKLLTKLRTLTELRDVSTDLLTNAPRLRVTINRDQAARFGITPQAIDDTLNDAYGQRQVTQYFTQLDTYWIILEVAPELQKSFTSLDRLYVKSPLTGQAVPLSVLVNIDTSRVGPLSVTHQGQFPAITLSFNLGSGVALGQAVDAITEAAREIDLPDTIIGTFQGNAQAFQSSLANETVLIAAALLAVYIILGMLYESYIHPLTILSTLPSAGLGALLALRFGHMDLSVIGIIAVILLIGIVKKNGIILVDFAIAAERDRGLSAVAAIRQACLQRLPPNHDDDRGRDDGRPTASARPRHRIGTASAPRLCDGRWIGAKPVAHALHHACHLSLSRSLPTLALELCLSIAHRTDEDRPSKRHAKFRHKTLNWSE